MVTVTNLFKSVLSQLGNADFGLLVVIDLAAFGAVFAAALVGCLVSQRVRAHDKRAFLCAVNAFTAITLAVFLTEFPIAHSVAASAVFWCAGYLLYGALSLFKVRKKRAPVVEGTPVQSAIVSSGRQVRQPQGAPANDAPPAQSGVRLEHALSIADKLLMKNLGRGDRQELEKIKIALTVLKVKGVLSPQEGESLNEMFNALLKLMAKYDL
ncbi:MAG: hypothetical protein K2O44_06235 [Clostridia bacterium]|nr:hypothetical protein [Clostridia bacterium]